MRRRGISTICQIRLVGQRSHRVPNAELQIGLPEEPVLIIGRGIAVPLVERLLSPHVWECGALGQPHHFYRLNPRTETTSVQPQISEPQPQRRNRGEVAYWAPFAARQGGTR